MLDDEQEDIPSVESGNPGGEAECPPSAEQPEDIPINDSQNEESPVMPEPPETVDPDADSNPEPSFDDDESTEPDDEEAVEEPEPQPDLPDSGGDAPDEEDGEEGDREEDADDSEEDDGEDDAESPSGPQLPLASVVEAILFAAREPLKPVQIARAAGKGVRRNAVRDAVAELNLHYLETSRAFEIAEISGRFQLMSRPEYAENLMRLYPKRELSERPGAQRLTPAALDTLSIIAYKQPVTRAEIERVRGVGCGPVLRSLIERGTIRVSGKLDVVGKPPLYATTEAFLVEFGLGSLDELPLRNDFLSAFPEAEPPSAAGPAAASEEEPRTRDEPPPETANAENN